MFLNPLMLFGIAAVSVPVIIHLLNKRRFERVVWAAMRFLRASVEQNQRRIRLEDMLLLILRCALLLLLALALARPVLRAGAAAVLGGAGVTAVIVLDNSYSMSQTDGVSSRFDLARQAAEEVLKTLPAGSSAAVLLGSDVVHELIAEPTYDLTLAAQSIRDAPLFDRSTNLLPALRRALETLGGRPSLRKEIYIITDGQALGWRQLDEMRRLMEENRREVGTHLIIVGQSEERNLGITSLRLEGGVVPVNVPVRVEARVRNYGRAEAASVNVRIIVNNDPPMDQGTIDAIPPGEERSVSLFARLKSDGYHTITAQLDTDRLPADDMRSVALRAVRDVKVLLVDGDAGMEARDSEIFYLKHALRPVPRPEWEDYFIKISSALATELDGVRFEDFDAVVLANVTDLAPGSLAQLAEYVRMGGALWVFPGDNVNVGFYNEELHRRHRLLPAALGEIRGDEKSQEKWLSLADRELTHPIVRLWGDPNAGTLSSARFFRVFDLVEETQMSDAQPSAESAPAGPGRIILRFTDDRPAMMERNWGQGRVILFASSADTEWNDLPVRAGIVIPLVHRTLAYLVARQDEHLTVRVGQPFVHTSPIEFIGKEGLITRSARPWAGREVHGMTDSRMIELMSGIPTLQYDRIDFAGTYEAKVGDALAVRFAAQADPEESDTRALTGEQLKLLGESARVLRWQRGASLRDDLEQARIGTELWLPLAMAALALATMETLLAHWFSKPK